MDCDDVTEGGLTFQCLDDEVCVAPCTQAEADGDDPRTCPDGYNCFDAEEDGNYFCTPNDIPCRAENGVIFDDCTMNAM